MDLKNIFLAHADVDHEFACCLSRFLEFGCNVTCSAGEGRIAQGQDLLAKAEEGLASDVLVLLLSEASWPVRWPREQWERILFEETRRSGVELLSVLLGDCLFPPLLRRRNFIDGRAGDAGAARQTTMRLVKRWIWHRETETAQTLNPTFAADLEDLYSNLSDQAGTLKTSGADASRFVREAGQEFDAVLWIPCYRRSLAQIARRVGFATWPGAGGTVAQNCRSVQDLLARRRCLLVLDAPDAELASGLIAGGRTSTLVTAGPVKVVETPRSLAEARRLVASRRYAEAYELLYDLLDSDISTADCARELTWICEHWNLMDEAESLRCHYRLPPTEQLSLF